MTRSTSTDALEDRVASLPWPELQGTLYAQGFVQTPTVLSARECSKLAGLYESGRFRSAVVMARHRFGEGEYKYFAAPLPPLVAALRAEIYSRLTPIANRWAAALGTDPYPRALVDYLARCAAGGQRRPTPLLLRYTAGGYNCLHQDLYGPLAFPLQVTCFLSQVSEDYTGGEFLLVEQRPRSQSRGEAIVLERGEAVIFPNRFRPVAGTRGSYRVTVRHGVSRLRSGERMSLGIIFHDAA